MISTLPYVQNITDCADYAKTVAPYARQVSELPGAIWDALSTNPSILNQFYTGMNPLMSGFAFSLFLAPVFLLISEVTGNYSQVDRVWSILPTIYNAHFALWGHLHGIDTSRLNLLLAVSVFWSSRLSFNYWRKGGYTVGSEDYRWEILRKYINPPLFFVFNVLFISLCQSVLLFSITTPTYVLLLLNHLSSSPYFEDTVKGTTSVDIGDFGFAAALIGINLITFISDQQQWNYQTTKHQYRETAKVPPNSKFTREELDLGFLVRGLFAWSRHPNFAAEQAMWVTVYLWASWKTQSLLNWTIVGPAAYLCLFQASTLFTEWVSRNKYPEYKDYQQQVGMFVPGKLLPKPRFGPADPSKFKHGHSKKKAITDGDVDAKIKNEEDKEQAKKRYDLR